MLKINTLHRTVMRQLLAGIPLEEICERERLDILVWQKTVESKLFKAEMAEMQKQVKEEITAQTAEEMAKVDPVLQRLKTLVMPAVNVIASEMENYDKELGATASTRLDAAKTLIAMEGTYAPRKDAAPSAPIININFSPGKLAMVEKRMKVATVVEPPALPA